MRGEKNHFSLLSWFVFIQIVNVPILIKIANLLKDLALKKKKELEEKKKTFKICSTAKKNGVKTNLSYFNKCKAKANSIMILLYQEKNSSRLRHWL